MKKFLWTIIFLFCSCHAILAQYDKDVFMWRGRQALADGKYAQAIDNFNILSRLDSTDYWSFFFRGISKYNLGDLRGAQKDFNTSVRLNPVFTNGYHYRAITESRLGDYDKALEDLQRAIDLRPGNMGVYFSRAVTFFLARKFSESLRDFNRYIRHEPKDPAAYLNRGACHLFLKDTTKALEDYNTAIRLDRFDPEGYIRRSRIHSELKRNTEAIADLDRAIELDPGNTFAHFNRALVYYDMKLYNEAMDDLNKVLEDEPGNALTLYNRSLIYAQVGDYRQALEDMDRVININPGNVLAHFNRAAFFVEMKRWNDALADYNKAIELYPDFAKAYMNRSYVESMLGLTKASKADYQTAREKVNEYKKNGSALSDTTTRFNSLLALDADFAKKDFDDELLQHRDIDIHLRPLYRFTLCQTRENLRVALSKRFENPLLDRFMENSSVPMKISGQEESGSEDYVFLDTAQDCFIRGLQDVQRKQFTSAIDWFDKAVEKSGDPAEKDRYARYYKAFYLLNRGVLKAEMIDFIASLEGNVQTLSLDDQGNTRARVSDQVAHSYDYSEAIADIQEAVSILPDIPYFHFNLGNLQCLSSNFVSAIGEYDKAIELHPGMGDAYLNRALVLIYLKDNEKGCIDLSRAGELGVADAYGIISKYCKDEEN